MNSLLSLSLSLSLSLGVVTGWVLWLESSPEQPMNVVLWIEFLCRLLNPHL